MSAPIGPDAVALASRLAVWRRIQEARISAEADDEYGFAAMARENVIALSGALENILNLHEPRDGRPYCPTCSTRGKPSPWPCPTWLIALRDMPRV